MLEGDLCEDQRSCSSMEDMGNEAFEDADGGVNVQKTSLAASFDDRVRPFIDIIDGLRHHGLAQDVDLPSVAAIGDQSSGKSSILEAISGIQLPRGSGIVTRCPLEIRLKKTLDPRLPWSANISYPQADGKHMNIPVNNPKQIENLIRQVQTDLTGGATSISSKLITLYVEGPLCPDLTLIDLPGIARTVVDDQPPEIIEQIKDLIKEYIERPETIILCVLPSNVDIATNEAITMARNVDPDGIRTLGVLTKPDLVDEGTETDVLAILQNKKVYLSKGYRIVRCRSQKEIIDGMDLSEAIRQEDKFFKSHRIFRTIEADMRGTGNLAEMLSENLVEHIKKAVPKLREEVRLQMDACECKLNDLGEGPPKEPSAKRLYFTRHSDKFCSEMERVVRNEKNVKADIFPTLRDEVATDLVNLAFMWRKCFRELKTRIEEITSQSFDTGYFVATEIQKKMKSYRGRELPGYVNFELFEGLIQEHILQYEGPANDCLEAISRDLMLVMSRLSEELLSHLPSIKGNIRCICEEVHKKCKLEGRRLLNLEIRKELLVYSQDPTYLDQLKSSLEGKDAKLNFQVYAGEEDIAVHNAGILRDLLKVYMDIANRRIADGIPMLLRTTQHSDFIDLLRKKLHETSSSEQTDDLLREDPRLAQQRATLQDKKRRLEEAMIILNKQ